MDTTIEKGGYSGDMKEAIRNHKLLGKGSISNKEGMIRADKIDLKNLNFKLDEEFIKRAFPKAEIDTNRPKMEWETDLASLQLRYVIAVGTYGTVYRANFGDKDVAVKVLDWDETSSTAKEVAELRSSFKKEVDVWNKLDHPNITKFIGASMGTSNLKIPSSSSNDGQSTLSAKACCIILEYVPGGTLKKYLIRNRRKKLPFKTVVQLALDLARGLEYLPSQKIVHRDVKTENMLLTSQRNVKIADFGVARVESQNPKDMTGETGTLGYMAPEVLVGKPYNHKCDVYGFGICLWETYCCDMPFADLSFSEASSAIVHQNLRPSVPRCCPQSLANVMKRCWDANPEKRPDMDEVVRLLEAIDTSKGGGMIPEDSAPGCFCFAPTRGP